MRLWNFLSITPDSGQMHLHIASAIYRDTCAFLDLELVISVEAPIIATAHEAPIIANRLYLQIEETYSCLHTLSRFFRPRASFR